jgi:hypothetical protein
MECVLSCLTLLVGVRFSFVYSDHLVGWSYSKIGTPSNGVSVYLYLMISGEATFQLFLMVLGKGESMRDGVPSPQASRGTYGHRRLVAHCVVHLLGNCLRTCQQEIFIYKRRLR